MSWTWLDDGVGSAEHGSEAVSIGKPGGPIHAKQAANKADSVTAPATNRLKVNPRRADSRCMERRLDRQTVQRLAIVAGLAGTFLLVGSLNQPQPSLAGSETTKRTAPISRTSPPKSLGTIQGKTLSLQIFTGPDEPIYSLRTTGGALLATGLTAEELLAAHPDKPELPMLLAGTAEGETLMLAPDEPDF